MPDTATYRSHTCGELNKSHIGSHVTLSGWLQGKRDLGGMTFIDLRDRYGITQLVVNDQILAKEDITRIHKTGRESVVNVQGKVIPRESINTKIPTGEIEIQLTSFNVLGKSELPPFTIETESDGGDELRMKHRYLDLRRPPLQKNLQLRHQLAQTIRNYLSTQSFLEIETPFLIKSTPEGARDFVVPSRMHQGKFYALPQSPQTFKQLLMVSGFDKYFQIVKCFRDEDLRADRQPEFTQIDCEMSFVRQSDVRTVFEGMMRSLFKDVKGIDLPEFPVMSYADAMREYGSDKPDLRFGMKFVDLTEIVQGKGFNVFDQSEIVIGICVDGAGDFSRKQLDELTDFVRKPQVGGKGLVYVKWQTDGTIKSSVDKFFSSEELKAWADKMAAKSGDLLLVVSGDTAQTRSVLNDLRIEMAERQGLRDINRFCPLWINEFPLMKWDEETQRHYALHHPFTNIVKSEENATHIAKGRLGNLKADAYDMVINGVEVGGGSIRITVAEEQARMLSWLGFTEEEARSQFGFLMEAFRYGTPPHGGIAFGFDRICALFGGSDSIRDFIAFPKNNAGKDVMLDAPDRVSAEQLDELGLKINSNE